MAPNWCNELVLQDSINRKAHKRSNGSWVVTDYSSGLQVLDLHNEAKVFDLTSDIIKDIKIAKEKNYNAGYFFQRSKEIKYSLIPLLPGYTVYTSAGNRRFKLSILENNTQLNFFWEEYGSDTSYLDKKAQGYERMAFRYMLKKYDLDSNNSIISILGLNIPEIIENLQQIVFKKFPSIIPNSLSESSKISNVTKKEETLRRSLGREIKKINLLVDENVDDNIIHGINIEPDGKILSPKETQVLMIKNMEYKKSIYSKNKTIKNLKEKINLAEKKNIEVITQNNNEIQKLVEKEIEENKLGSTIFINTKHYLSILYLLPCPNCSDIKLSNKKLRTKVNGFNITCTIKCQYCKTISQYSNEDLGVKFSYLVAGAALAGGVNRNSIQTLLATIGLTNQSSKRTYHYDQTRLYKPIIEYAKFSSKTILLEILDQLKKINLPGEEKILPIGFDCSWSHSRNAHQASGEFIYLGNLPGYNYQPVIGFYTVEHSRLSKLSDESLKILHKGNFDGTSRQMEHAILIELLNNIMPILEEYDFTLHICVDGDLETNKTLACIPAVSRIFADLKHVSKNIRKNLLKKKYSRWHSFEQHIMRYFNSCIFVAGIQKKNNQNSAPTEEETRHIQVESLIQHLHDNHNLCWSDVCWIKDNPELQLQEPTLKNYTQTEIVNFRNVLMTIFRVPFGQGLVTTFRTSYNEAFNRKILKYLDKRIDYWASYCARHALTIIDQNDGLDTMISKVHKAAIEIEFSSSDIYNITKFVQERSQQVIRNRNTIQQRNEMRKIKYASEKQELAGFDFDKELVSYKSKTIEQICENIFWPSFGNLLIDFDVIVKCIACHAFAKKSSRGLCGVCSFYVEAGLWERIIDDRYVPKGERPESLELEKKVLLAAIKIFGFEELRYGQMEAIIAYLNNNDTFLSMKTGGGKTLCYALSAICSEGLTIVFSPLKALMEDQKRELIKVGIPCATLYANLQQGINAQEKIFEEITCGLIKILFVTPEKLVSNEGFCRFITRFYDQKKVRFVIDEAHCIIFYQDFRKAWGQLRILKQRWESAPIMLLTATCTRLEVDEIRENLSIDENNFTLIRGSTSQRQEIIFSVKERKEIQDQYIIDIINIIDRNLQHGRIIIYCPTHSNCELLFNKLQENENLSNILIGYYHGGLRDDERETTMNNWKLNNIQIMVATSAFGMGINSNNIRVVIHVGAPMSMTNLIQEAGRAGRDGNMATHIIYYNKKDIRINYSIVAEYKETESITINDQILSNKLARASNKIFEVLYYCNSQFECRQQLIWKYQAWPNEESPPMCEKCDNCINRMSKKPKLFDGKDEIIKLLEVIEFLTQEKSEQIGPEDVVDVFRGGKTAKIKQKKWDTLPVYPTEKRKVLKTKELVSFALLDLVVRGLVQEKIILRKPNEGGSLSSSIVVVGVIQGAQANANMQSWQYFVK